MKSRETVALEAITAWEKGENSGNYADFRKMLSTNFDLFSHPLLALFRGEVAKEKMLALLAERESAPNHLTFSQVVIATNDTVALVAFASKGKIMNGEVDYEGFNVIAFKIEGEQIKGFQEYFGLIDPGWFK